MSTGLTCAARKLIIFLTKWRNNNIEMGNCLVKKPAQWRLARGWYVLGRCSLRLVVRGSTPYFKLVYFKTKVTGDNGIVTQPALGIGYWRKWTKDQTFGFLLLLNNTFYYTKKLFCFFSSLLYSIFSIPCILLSLWLSHITAGRVLRFLLEILL